MKSLLTLALLASLGTAALAQTSYITSGALTTTDPTFRRPNTLTTQVTTTTTSGSAAAYDVYAFTVSASGTYVGEANSPDTLDTYLFIYSGAFDPASPLTNLLNADDDGSTLDTFSILPGVNTSNLRKSRISTTTGTGNYVNGSGLVLTAGTTYFAVASSFYNATNVNGQGVGTYSIGIGGGPGDVTAASAVPEPATMAALGLGALAMLKRRRKQA